MKTYRTCVYVDGLNFFGDIKELNSYLKKEGNNITFEYPSLKQICKKMFHSLEDEYNPVTIRYFTVNYQSSKKQSSKAKKEASYNRALKSEGVQIDYGKFLDGREKRTDVNLAINLLYDAWKGKYDYAVILSNDTDFVGLISLMKKEFKDKTVGVWTLSPNPAPDLINVVSKGHYRQITPGDLNHEYAKRMNRSTRKNQ